MGIILMSAKEIKLRYCKHADYSTTNSHEVEDSNYSYSSFLYLFIQFYLESLRIITETGRSRTQGHLSRKESVYTSSSPLWSQDQGAWSTSISNLKKSRNTNSWIGKNEEIKSMLEKIINMPKQDTDMHK